MTHYNTEKPSVTIGIPALNEAQHIESVILSFLNSGYPKIVEIIVADGGSTDGTRDIIEKIGAEDPRVRWIDNPARRQAAGMNLIIEQAKGEILLRADAHCDYADDYVSRCISAMQKTNAINVSGSQRHVAKADFQAGVALASRTWFGNGGAPYKDPEYEGFADTVFLGCFKLDILKKLGGYKLFDSNYVNEDAELNARIIDYQPKSVYISADIKVWYYPRNSVQTLWKQYFYYGKSRCITNHIHAGKTPMRGRLPFIFITCCLLLIIADLLFITHGALTSVIIVAGLLSTLLGSISIVYKFKNKFVDEIWRGAPHKAPSVFKRVINTWLSIITMAISHFSGYAVQQLKFFFVLKDKAD